MEQDHSQEETPREEKMDERVPTEEVDYKGLSRLVEARPSLPPPAASAPFARAPEASAPMKSGAPIALVAAIVGLIVLIGIGVGSYLLTRSKAADSTPTSRSDTRPDGTRPENTTPVKAEMIAIPGGTFQMGRDDGPPQESPSHTVTVGAFSMDNTEVTNAEYAQFVKDTGHTAPAHFVNNKPPSGQEQWPVVNVSVEDAQAFAAWRSKRDNVTYRLPTEEEWEYAARNGERDTLYPWDDKSGSELAAVNSANTPSLRPVGSYPNGKNRWGVVDLIGNVWEWTASKASVYPGGKMQLNPAHKDWSIVRGGSVVSSLSGDKPVTSAYRDWIPPNTKNPYLGFRLVRSGEK